MCFYCVKCGACDRALLAEEFESSIRIVHCASCGSELGEGAKACPVCGKSAPLPAGMAYSGESEKSVKIYTDPER